MSEAGSNKNTATVHERLRLVQTELKAPKGQSGRFGKHRNVEDILEALKPLLTKHGLAVTLSNDMVEIGPRIYVKATATAWAEDGTSVAVDAYAWEGELSRGLDAPQVTGSASSYARKYALGGLFAVDDSKDPDSHKDPAEPAKAAPAPAHTQKDSDPATPTQKNQLKNMMTQQGMEKDAMGLLVESVLEKPTVDTFADYKAVKKAMEEE